MLRRNPSLTEQAKVHIKQMILEGEFEDDRIPSETELAQDLGVSRTTIRGALARLEVEGVVTRKQGSGTFLNAAGLQIHSRLEEIWSYEDILRAHGYEPSVKVLNVTELEANDQLQNALDLEPNSGVVAVNKLFLQDNEPVILTHNFIPSDLIQREYDSNDFDEPVYEFLDNHCQRRLAYYLTDIVPMTADDELAELMEIPNGTPLLSLDEIGYADNNEAIIKAQSFFRDDLVRLRLIRRQT